jgi:hypothetical protein
MTVESLSAYLHEGGGSEGEAEAAFSKLGATPEERRYARALAGSSATRREISLIVTAYRSARDNGATALQALDQTAEKIDSQKALKSRTENADEDDDG